MADIDTNQHRSHVFHCLGELQIEQVSLHLGIELAQDIGGLAHVELTSIARRDDLRRDLKLVEELFVHAVVVLVAKDDYHDLRVAEVAIRRILHILEQMTLNLGITVLILDFDEVGLFDTNLELLTSTNKSFID